MSILIYSPVSETLAGPIGSNLLTEEGLSSIDPMSREEVRQFYQQHNAVCKHRSKKWGKLWRGCEICYDLSNIIILYHGIDFFRNQ